MVKGHIFWKTLTADVHAGDIIARGAFSDSHLQDQGTSRHKQTLVRAALGRIDMDITDCV